MKRIVITVLAAAAIAAAAITISANVMVKRTAKGLCYDDTAAIPYRRVGLLLGTSKLNRHGGPNPYFTRRIKACAALYHAGKISKVLVSGDNSRIGYTEPEDMRQALVEAGVPDSVIVLDYAGFRTYDSMVRAKKVFGQQRLTVVSQPWHNERALYIAHRIGVDAIAYNAADFENRQWKLRLTVREWLARTKMAVDLLSLHDPHFLGEPIEI